MQTYWIVRENGKIVAAMVEKYYENNPQQLIQDIRDLAATGPVECIRTSEPIKLGGTIEKFVRPRG